MSFDSTLGVRDLEDGRRLTLYAMLYGNTRLCIGDPEDLGYDVGYCYQHIDLAFKALKEWDGRGHPYGFFKIAGSDIYQHEFAR